MKQTLIAVVVCLSILSITPLSQAARLVWDASTGTVNGYRVYLDDMDAPAADVAPDVTEWALPEDLVVGQEYLLGVSAWNQAGESAKAKVRFTWQEDIEIVLPMQPINIYINFEQ